MSTLPITSLCSINPETLNGETPPDWWFRYLDISAVNTGRIDWATTTTWKYAEAPSRARRVLRQGDALLCTVRPGLQSHALITTEPIEYLVGSTGFAVLRPHQIGDASFVFHSLFSNGVAAQLRARETGSSYPAVNERDVRAIQIFCPPPNDRTRIANVLDTADEAIAKTEAVIAKLRQVRTGLIHDLLTCGLDENGHLRDPIAHPEQFKDSPLGSIPLDWDVCQLRDTIERVYDYRGRTPLKIGMDWGGGDIPALSANNVEMGQVNFAKEAHLGSPKLYAKWMTQGDTEEGDVLMTMEAPLGNIAQVPDNKRYILSQRVILLRPKPQRFTKDYLALQMAGPRFQKELVRQSSGSTAVGIQRAKLELIQVAVPMRQEEQESAAQLIRLNDKQIRQHEAELIKLQSIKSGLMDDLLTGRVRVPEAR